MFSIRARIALCIYIVPQTKLIINFRAALLVTAVEEDDACNSVCGPLQVHRPPKQNTRHSHS
jgi:hypothetical protein